jgi:hypothetical protein
MRCFDQGGFVFKKDTGTHGIHGFFRTHLGLVLVKYQRGPVGRNAVELLLLGNKMDLGLPRLSCHRDRLSY